MNLAIKVMFLLVTLSVSLKVFAHGDSSKAHYLGNEGVMIEVGGEKILFDPFFHNSYGHYTLVPTDIRQAIFENKTPYNNIKAIFISHAHEDHFDKDDMMKYLLTNKSVSLVAPAQAVTMLKGLAGFEKIKDRVFPVNLEKGQAAQNLSVDKLGIEAVRIPHAGWPSRAEVENIVFRVSVNQEVVVMHMGDADPNPSHFNEHKSFWPKLQTDIAFPPYWFSLSPTGQRILNNVINAKKSVGVHVPTNVPPLLKSSGADYFSKPGETREIKTD